MASFNRVILAGNCTKEVELKYTQSGMAVVELGLAVNEKRKDAGGNWVDDVVFVDVTFFGKTAEVAGEYVQKGSPILIEGRLKLDQWTSQSGEKRSKLKVTGDKLVLLGTKPREGQSPGQAAPQTSAPASGGQAAYNDQPPRQPAPAMDDGDNLPF